MEPATTKEVMEGSRGTDTRGLVCVTGASGYFGSWLVKRLLERGYRVRGTVRDVDDPSKTAHLLKLLGAKERLELVRAELLDERSINAAVDGCEGVFHTASSILLDADDPQAQIIEPALTGTLNVLKACAHYPTVKRVVMTSSASTVTCAELEFNTQVLDESFWSSVELCTQLKLWYPLSKTLAEQAAWKFSMDKKFTFISIIPSVFLGPILPTNISTSAKDILAVLRGSRKYNNNVYKPIKSCVGGRHRPTPAKRRRNSLEICVRSPGRSAQVCSEASAAECVVKRTP